MSDGAMLDKARSRPEAIPRARFCIDDQAMPEASA